MTMRICVMLQQQGRFPQSWCWNDCAQSVCFRSHIRALRLVKIPMNLCCIIEACQTAPYQNWAVISKHRILWHVHINIFWGFLYLWQTVRFGFHGLTDVLVWLFHLETKCFLDWAGNVAYHVLVSVLPHIPVKSFRSVRFFYVFKWSLFCSPRMLYLMKKKKTVILWNIMTI